MSNENDSNLWELYLESLEDQAMPIVLLNGEKANCVVNISVETYGKNEDFGFYWRLNFKIFYNLPEITNYLYD